MRLLDSLLGRSGERFNPASASGASVLVSTYGTPDTERILGDFEDLARNGFHANPIIYSLIQTRVLLFSEAEFKFQSLTDKSLYGTPALLPLEQPWPNGTTGELLARMEQDASLAGNAFIRRHDDGRLERWRPDWVSIASEIVVDDQGRERREVLGYFYGAPGTEPQFADVSEVAHWSPIPDPLASFRGMSWLTSVIREVNADVAMTGHKQTFLDKAATPNMVLRYQKSLTETQLDRLREMMRAKHGGPENAGGTLVLDEGADLTVVGNSFEQMSFTAVQAAGENRIAAAAGVPGIVVGLKEGLAAATYSNYEQAMRRFADLTMRPLWRSACAALAPLVEVPSGARLWFDVSGIAALRQGEKERAETFGVKADTVGSLIRAGYVPATVALAVEANDLGLLKHTGNVPVTLYPDGADPKAAPPARSEPEPVRDRAAAVVVNVPEQPAPVVHNHYEQAAPVVNASIVLPDAERAEAPVVNVTVEPTPVQVDVAAPDVTVNAPVTVQPADVNVLPVPPTKRTVKRNSKGEIVAVVEE